MRMYRPSCARRCFATVLAVALAAVLAVAGCGEKDESGGGSGAPVSAADHKPDLTGADPRLRGDLRAGQPAAARRRDAYVEAHRSRCAGCRWSSTNGALVRTVRRRSSRCSRERPSSYGGAGRLPRRQRQRRRRKYARSSSPSSPCPTPATSIRQARDLEAAAAAAGRADRPNIYDVRRQARARQDRRIQERRRAARRHRALRRDRLTTAGPRSGSSPLDLPYFRPRRWNPPRST